VTLHNQRDFIFVRHHRYIYRQEEDTNLTNAKMKADVKKGINSKKTSKNAIKEMKRREKEEEDDDDDVQEKEEKEAGIPMKTRARLQELGPRFTLKLKWLQEGLLDTQFGEYEWIQGKRNQMKRSRRKFFL
jgi:rRNA maturation protein Rpf1